VFRLQSAPVDAAALTRECLEAIRPQADAKRLALQLQLDPKIRWIEVDGQRLRQILLNLLANAVKFTDAGTITLALQRVAEASGMIEWSVRDTGPGIAPEDQERIFEPFVRLDRDQAIAGAGMGLALCARLCTAMNGALTVSSDGETGTTFTVRLPLPSVEASLRDVRPGAHEQGRREAASPSEAWRGLRVLIADDNTLVRELLVAFFEAQQAAITAVADGLAAVEACATCEFDVIVLDLSMPWLDGREAARRLREPGVALGQPWIIGLSAHAGREEAETALAAGMNRFLTKPVALRELAAVVAEAPRLRAQPMPSPVTNTADLALARRLTRQFAAETPAIVMELHAAFANGDRSRLRSRAHYLKNSADVLGADALRRACTALYVQAESADPEALRELVATIESAARSPLASAEFRPENPAQSQPQ
jgi:CheY-like chemotaxis protein/anti-sigma regulatory factor (Ser/Thr protein kinase)